MFGSFLQRSLVPFFLIDFGFQDCSKRETEYVLNAGVFKEKYQQVCKEMGVKVRAV